MEVGLGIEISAELERLGPATARIQRRLTDFFTPRSYGDDPADVYIGLILMGPASEKLHPVRRLAYKKACRVKSRITKQTLEFRNHVTFDIKPDYERLRTLGSEAAETYISQCLIEGTAQLEKAQAKYRDFDVQRFREDLVRCLLDTSV
jgi:hypothetical protein